MAAESKLERRCAKLADERGFWMPKWSAPGNRGVMDRILFRPGRVTFIEFKAPGKKLTKLQEHTANVLREVFRADVRMIDNFEDFEKLLNENGEKTCHDREDL